MRGPPDPERIADAIVAAHVKAMTVAIQTLRPHLVTIIERAIADAKDGQDSWRQIGDVVKEDLFSK
jgi:hypothetical protein